MNVKGKVKWYNPRKGYEFFEGEDSDKRLSVIPSDFRKNNQLEVELHPESSRMRLYKLKLPTEAIQEIAE